jgi:hypothetical protein
LKVKIRVGVDPHRSGKLNPDQHGSVLPDTDSCGYGIMRIRNTA